MLWRLRRILRRRRGHRPEEEVFERFSEKFSAPVSRQTKFRQEPQEEPRPEYPRNTQPTAPTAPPSPALKVLGLGAGASPEEIAASYKRMARTYHPDKVAGEPQEVREFFERRMKEINAAYSQLKHR